MNETAFCRFERRRCCCCCWCWCCYCCCCCCCWHVTSQRKRIGLSPAETRVFCFCFRPNESKANRWIVSIHFECGGPNFPIGQLSRVRCQSAIKATNSETQLPFDEFSHYKNTINETFFPAKKKTKKKTISHFRLFLTPVSQLGRVPAVHSQFLWVDQKIRFAKKRQIRKEMLKNRKAHFFLSSCFN